MRMFLFGLPLAIFQPKSNKYIKLFLQIIKDFNFVYIFRANRVYVLFRRSDMLLKVFATNSVNFLKFKVCWYA